jgi:heme exporter protein C
MPMNLDPSMRLVFYPAVVGWILLGVWILNLRVRIRKLTMDNG